MHVVWSGFAGCDLHLLLYSFKQELQKEWVKPEKAWGKNEDYKARYSKLYYSRLTPLPIEDDTHHISFMNRNDATPYTSLLMKMRANRYEPSQASSGFLTPEYLTSLMSQRSTLYGSTGNSQITSRNKSDDLGGNETMLLDMVRAHSREVQDETQDEPLDLPKDDASASDELSSEACVHGLSMRMTERSVSRSRISRISTRRDMDIPSILAFTTVTTPAPIPLEIPAFQKVNIPQREQIPRWSIRRSVCPVCSQKWKDRSSIRNVKNSGLKKNSSIELPSVIAPARLRTSIAIGYVPRPTLAALDEDVGTIRSGLRNTSASWQLTRARRFRIPKPQMRSPEATAPPSATAPLARKDLNSRVNRFLTDEEINTTT